MQFAGRVHLTLMTLKQVGTSKKDEKGTILSDQVRKNQGLGL